MTASTITRPAGLEHRIEPLMVRIYELLKSRPDQPISYEEVSSLIPDASYNHVIETLTALEGPAPSETGSEPAYIRCCNKNEKAVYID